MSSAASPHKGQDSLFFFTSHAQLRQYSAVLCSTVPEWTNVIFAGNFPHERQTVLAGMEERAEGETEEGRMADIGSGAGTYGSSVTDGRAIRER